MVISQEYGFPDAPSVVQVRTWTNQEAFLAEYVDTGAVYKSAANAGHSIEAYQTWLNTDKYGFQKRFDHAKARYLEAKVLEISRRAFDGYDHPVIYKGMVTDTYKAYDPQLAMFVVKQRDPSYRDNAKEVDNATALIASLDALRSLGVPRLPKVVDGTSEVVEE